MQTPPVPASAKPPLDLLEFDRRLTEFDTVIDAEKERLRVDGQPFEFYPYDTIGSLSLIMQSLPPAINELLTLEEGAAICDIGCGDGDLSLFLETLGHSVDAVDYPDTNYNKMNGVRAMAAERHSRISISEIDLNAGFTLPRSGYQLTLLLGVLYHVKNPFYVLEQIARASDACILSTRIAEVSPDKAVVLRDQPVAFLVDDRELNADTTNYWIFTEMGLRRLLHRTGWTVTAWKTAGCANESDPISASGDARAFCLLHSRLRSGRQLKLGDGWHGLEQQRYRWTEREFTLVLPRPDARAHRMRFEFVAPPPVFAQGGPLVLSAETEGWPLGSMTYEADGAHVYECVLPARQDGSAVVRVRFRLNQAMPPTPQDPRELGVIAAFYDWNAGRYEFIPPVTLEPA